MLQEKKGEVHISSDKEVDYSNSSTKKLLSSSIVTQYNLSKPSSYVGITSLL